MTNRLQIEVDLVQVLSIPQHFQQYLYPHQALL